MSVYPVKTPGRSYNAVVERGILRRAGSFIPAKAGQVFVVTTSDVWELHGAALTAGLGGRAFHRIIFPGGEDRKRLSSVETMAEEMMRLGGDRSSLVIAFGGGIVNDLGGFLAAIFMRGVPVIQIPTTLLSQVDAAVGGKTGANLVSGKNLVGAFHQPLAVLTDPGVLMTLPEREYRAGLFEVIKHGIIRSAPLFGLMRDRKQDVLKRDPAAVEEMISESVRIKCEVVSADEKEAGLRRILNYGHTVGHAIEAETHYQRYLHGEAVALGMKAVGHLGHLTGRISGGLAGELNAVVDSYGPLPPANGIQPEALLRRLAKDKKAIQGEVHWVLPRGIGEVEVTSGVDEDSVLRAIRAALA